MSFLKKLFGIGGGGREPAAPASVKEIEHKGYVVRAEPFAAGGQFQVAGTIEKREGDSVRRQSFVRADLAGTIDEAAETALQKGRRIIDEQGDSLFR